MGWVIIANPWSGGGATGARKHALEQLAREILDAPIRWTDAPGAGRRLAQEALDDGFTEVAALGGDGTISEVVDGLVAVGGGTLGVVPSGTGGDFARALSLSRDPRQAMEALRDGEARPVDVLHVEAIGAGGTPVERFGINLAGIGMAGDVVRRVNDGSKRLGGQVTFAVATLKSLWAWDAPAVNLRWVAADGRPGGWSGRLTNAFVGNGRYCGGGMHVTPGAQLDDGLLDLVIIPDQPLFDLVRRTPALYRGTVGRVPEVVTAKIRDLVVEPASGGKDEGIPLDLDGEAIGWAPAHLTVRSGLLRLVVRRSSATDAVFGVDPAPSTR